MAQTGLQSAKSKELRKTLDNLIEGYKQNPEDITELLAFKSRFYNYSMNNNILIYNQNPYATFVASFEEWKKKGYRVKNGQHGIKIIFPIRTEIFEVGEKDGKKQYRRVADASPEEKALIESGNLKPFFTTRFGVGHVFDISQTDCPQEDYPKIYHMGFASDQHAALYETVKQFVVGKGFPVNEVDLQSIALRGQFFPNTGEIQISDKLNDTEKLSTLTHEFGHALLHSDPASREKVTSVKELEADCISIMLQQEFGIELTDSRKKHFVDHYNVCKVLDDFKLEDVLKNVNIAYLNLRKELDPIIESALQTVKKEADITREEVQPNASILQVLAENYPGLKINTGYYVLDEAPGYAIGFNPQAPEALVLWQTDSDGGYINGEYRQSLDQYDQRDLVEAGLHTNKIQEILTTVGYTFEPDPPEEERYSEPAADIISDKSRILTETISKPKETNKSHSYQDFREQDAAVLDYIKRGVSILRVAEDMGFTPQQIGGYYTLKEHDSVRIYPDTNSFHRFSADVGGSTIDFVMHFGGMNQKQAIQSLKDKYVGDRFDSLPQATPQKTSPPEIEKKFELPEKTEGKYSRAFAYLTKTRCLDEDIVQQCMKSGLIYEDKKHNVVFVGNDTEGKPVYATRHTTLTDSNYKRDVAGSKQDVGFMVDNKAERLYVTEAPIDALSIMCLRKHQGYDIKAANYMATCGTGKDAALYFRLKSNPNIKEVILANDNDDGGQKANQKIFKTLHNDFPGIKVSYIKPKEKDINEHLCKFNKEKCGRNPKKQKGQEVER